MSKKRKASDKPSIGGLRTKGKNTEQQQPSEQKEFNPYKLNVKAV